MRIYTCTPFPFGGGEDFFARDSGLMCRGLQACGHESMAVMPGDRQPEDRPDLLRTEYANLESVAWWKTQQLDGVILYAWGHPTYRNVARAIREAGITLILNQDNGGWISPLGSFQGWLHELWIILGGKTSVRTLMSFFKAAVKGITYGLCVTDPLRAIHLKQGHIIACVSPTAAKRYQLLCKSYGGDAMVRRVRMLPHPVEPRFQIQAQATKSRMIACVGRWQDLIQKRPALMQAVLEQVLTQDAQVRVEIAGELTETLSAWHQTLPASAKHRVRLRGRLGRDELVDLFQAAQVFYSPSAYESFGIAAGEALCTGCSVVAGPSPSMAAFEWFTSENFGTLAQRDRLEEHVAALIEELAHWDQGRRNAQEISKTWSEHLHAPKVAARATKMILESRQSQADKHPQTHPSSPMST